MSGYPFHEHANHNREVCLLLKRAGKHDWVVTTAFYSGIHRLYDSIFPLKTIIGDKVVSFQSFTEYAKHNKDNSNMGKHEILGRAVVESGLAPNARKAYEFLKSSSFTARYNDYRTTETLASQSISRLDILDQACESMRSKRDQNDQRGGQSRNGPPVM